jgi:DNA-binding NtrC family response regulator
MSEFETKTEVIVPAAALPVGETEPMNGHAVSKSNGQAAGSFSLRRFRAEAEVQAISRALEQTGWHRKRAAQLLRISYRCLLYKIHQYKITPAPTQTLAPSAPVPNVE